MVAITGKVLRVLPLKELDAGDNAKKVVDLIIADEFEYQRVSFWEEKAEMVSRGEIMVGDVLHITNASISTTNEGGTKRIHVGKYANIAKIDEDLEPLCHTKIKAMKVTVLAVARPEKGQVCIAGINESGEWIRPQGVYIADMDAADTPPFKNLCISSLYADAWWGRHPRKEDRFFVYSTGVKKELDEAEKREFLELHLDASVDEVFKCGRSLGLIKPRIIRVYDETVRKGRGEKSYERYLRFTFKDASGRVHRGWSCRCNDFHSEWNAMKQEHRWTYGWRMLRYLQKNETYLAIGLTHTDYGVSGLKYGAYPLVVGVHVVQNHK